MPSPLPLIRQVVDLQRAQLAGLTDVRAVGRLKPIYVQAREELAKRLRLLQVTAGADNFSVVHLRAVLAQVTSAIKDMEEPLRRHIEQTGELAANTGARQVAHMIGKVEGAMGRMTPVIQATQLAVVRGVYPEIAPTLLDRFRRSSKLYGPQALNAIRNGLAQSMVQAETVDEAVDRLLDPNPLHGLFEGQRWRAERIVRTEMSYATNAAAQRGMVDFKRRATPRLMKRLVATRDVREGDDSKDLDGQTVDVLAPFIWQVKNAAGEVVRTVEYMHPPNRPHDREVMVSWLPEWGAPATVASGGEVKPTTAGLGA